MQALTQHENKASCNFFERAFILVYHYNRFSAFILSAN